MISLITEQGIGCDNIIQRIFSGASIHGKPNQFDKEEDYIIDHFDTNAGWMFLFNVHESLHSITVEYDIPTSISTLLLTIREVIGMKED